MFIYYQKTQKQGARRESTKDGVAWWQHGEFPEVQVKLQTEQRLSGKGGSPL